MKKATFLMIIAVVTLLGTLGSCKQLSKPQLSTKIDTASYSYGAYIGKSLVNQNMDVLDLDLIMRGMEDVLKKEIDTMDINEIQMILTMFYQDQQAARLSEQYEENKTAGEEFLEKNKNLEGVITTESGLQYKILEEGTGVSPDENDIVHVFYKGTLVDGTEFDSSDEEPVIFAVNSVISGWTEVLQLMKEGSKWEVYIPQELAYGSTEMGSGLIEPFSALIFEIELVKVEPQE